jgi:hypothetical protein
MLTRKEIIQKLEKLSPLESFIFQFYKTELETLHAFEHPIGGQFHQTFLIENSEELPIHQQLKELPRQTFTNKAKKMVNLAEACSELNLESNSILGTPPPEVPSYSAKVSEAFKGTKLTPLCPHARATFDWWDHSAVPRPTKTQITAIRVLFSSLVTEKNITFEWLQGTKITNSALKVKVKYPDLMNYPAEACELVTDQHGRQVFDEKHPVTSAFAEQMDDRRGEDGSIYDDFIINFDKEQDSTFVAIPDAHITGFDLLRGKWLNDDGDAADFRILQILVKEKDLMQNRKGGATSKDCGHLSSKRKKKVSKGMFTASVSPHNAAPHTKPPVQQNISPYTSPPSHQNTRPSDHQELATEKKRLARMQRKHLADLDQLNLERERFRAEAQQERQRKDQELHRLREEANQEFERLKREKANLHAQANEEVHRKDQELHQLRAQANHVVQRLEYEKQEIHGRLAAVTPALKKAPAPVAAPVPVDARPRAVDPSTADLIARAKARMESHGQDPTPGVPIVATIVPGSSSTDDDDSSYMTDDGSYSFSDETALTSGFFAGED